MAYRVEKTADIKDGVRELDLIESGYILVILPMRNGRRLLMMIKRLSFSANLPTLTSLKE